MKIVILIILLGSLFGAHPIYDSAEANARAYISPYEVIIPAMGDTLQQLQFTRMFRPDEHKVKTIRTRGLSRMNVVSMYNRYAYNGQEAPPIITDARKEYLKWFDPEEYIWYGEKTPISDFLLMDFKWIYKLNHMINYHKIMLENGHKAGDPDIHCYYLEWIDYQSSNISLIMWVFFGSIFLAIRIAAIRFLFVAWDFIFTRRKIRQYSMLKHKFSIMALMNQFVGTGYQNIYYRQKESWQEQLNLYIEHREGGKKIL